MIAWSASPVGSLAQETLTRYTLDRWPHLVLVLVVVTGLFSLAVAVLARVWRRPLDRLATELDAIAAGDMERRVTLPPPGAPAHPLGRSLTAAIDRLVGAIRANERLLADAAHELRSPFTVVRGVLELEALEDDRPALRDAIGEVDRANRLLDDLLLLARTTSHGAHLETVDADDVVSTEIRRLQRTYPHVDVEHHVAPVQIEAIADSLHRVVWNLLDNAAKYGRGAIRVTLEQLKDQLILWVDDNGTTVPSHDRARIRQRFQRSGQDRSGTVNGSGLGLAIVDDLVDLHGGSFRLSASPLGGCQAMVALPLSPDRPGADAGGRVGSRLAAWLERRLPAMTVGAFALLLLGAVELAVLATYWSFGTGETASTSDSPAQLAGGGPGGQDSLLITPGATVEFEVPGAGPDGAVDDSVETEVLGEEGGDGTGGRGGDASGAIDPRPDLAAVDPRSMTATASHVEELDPPENAIDGDPGTRWTSGVEQGAGMWFQIDLGRQMEVDRLELVLAHGYAGDYPRSFRVDLLDSATDPVIGDGEPAATVRGAEGSTVVELEARSARLIRISLLPVDTVVDSWWSISEVVVVAS